MRSVSAEVIDKIRALRKMQKISAQTLADRISAAGWPVSRAQVANYENQRANTLPLDFVVYAAEALGTTVHALLTEDVVCPGCAGAPPAGFTCNTCGTSTEAGGSR